MKKTSVLPLIIIISTFLVIPVGLWIFNFKNSNNDVRGAETGSSGLSIKVVSKDGSWDMSKYLCEDRDTCIQFLTSGKSLDRTSGGGVEDQEVGIKYSSDWDQYQYIKVFVESGWGSADRRFRVAVIDSAPGAFVQSYEVGSQSYEAVIFPLSALKGSVLNAAIFSDR